MVYGIRLLVGGCKDKLAFFRQLHADYAYGADIYFNKRYLGTHLYTAPTDSQKKRAVSGDLQNNKGFLRIIKLESSTPTE